MVVDGRVSLKRASYLWNVDGDNFLLAGIVDGIEVQRVLVLAVIDLGSEVHQTLDHPGAGTESRVMSDGPRLGVDLFHLVLGNTADATLFDDLWVSAAGCFHLEKLFDDKLHRGPVTIPLGTTGTGS